MDILQIFNENNFHEILWLSRIRRKRRLRLLRKSRYPKSVKDAVKGMKEDGCDISEDSIYRLEKGGWPSEEQVEDYCDHYDVEEAWLVFGANDKLEKLEDDDKEVVEKLIKKLTPPK